MEDLSPGFMDYHVSNTPNITLSVPSNLSRWRSTEAVHQQQSMEDKLDPSDAKFLRDLAISEAKMKNESRQAKSGSKRAKLKAKAQTLPKAMSSPSSMMFQHHDHPMTSMMRLSTPLLAKSYRSLVHHVMRDRLGLQ